MAYDQNKLQWMAHVVLTNMRAGFVDGHLVINHVARLTNTTPQHVFIWCTEMEDQYYASQHDS